MTYRLNIPARAYAAASHCVSDEESRPIINGIHVTVENGRAVLCGTDGHALVMTSTHSPYPEDGVECEALPEAGFILPTVKLSALGITAKGLDSDMVTFGSPDGDHWTVSALNAYKYGNAFTPSGKLAQVRTIEGPYPNVLAVIPRSGAELSPLTSIAFDPSVLNKAAKYFGKVTLAFTGSERAVVVRPSEHDKLNMTALIMPVRPATSWFGTPEWVHAPAVEPEVEAVPA